MSVRNVKYKVVAEVKKSWFKKPKLVYCVVKEYEYWDNSIFPQLSDWSFSQSVVSCYDSRQEAENVAKELNK